MEEQKISIGARIRSFYIQSTRVWHLLRKPTKEEVVSISKISAIGMLLIGVIGFVISDLIKWIS